MADNPEKISRSRFKFIESDPNLINKNSLNNSVSKMQYSIPKSPRWTIEREEYVIFNV